MGQYDKYVKPLTFSDYGYGSFRQGTRLGPEVLGMDVIIEFGTYWSGGQIEKPHKHDFNQICYWFSGNTGDMSELSAEIELFLGEENERHMLTASTAVGIPAGMPHMPANILKMDHRFIFMEILIIKLSTFKIQLLGHLSIDASPSKYPPDTYSSNSIVVMNANVSNQISIYFFPNGGISTFIKLV